MRSLLLSVVALAWVAAPAAAQSAAPPLRGTVVDAATGAPLPFANVYDVRLGTGTAANDAGYFELPGARAGDTLRVSYVGYRTEAFALGEAPPTSFALEVNTSDLGAVEVVADDDYLFDVLQELRRSHAAPEREAKTYFFLESFIGGERAEVIEGYYNGTYGDYATRGLDFKKGRVGLREVGGRMYTSTASSTLFTKHDLFAHTPLFPDNPLSMSRARARRTYSLDLANRYRDGDADVYVIAFAPRKDTTRAFSGELHVDRAGGALRKASLSILNAGVHPFLADGANEVLRVAMFLERTYAELDGAVVPERISVDYRVAYRDGRGGSFVTRTTTFTRPYDYAARFALPRFPYDVHENQDYRDVSSAPYDTAFWTGTQGFRFYDQLGEVDAFIRETERLAYRTLDVMPADTLTGLLQTRYLRWDTARVRFVGGDPVTVARYRQARGRKGAKFVFGAHLYLDVTELPNGAHYHTGAALDPVTTRFAYPVGPAERAFLNLAFDLLEVQRRALERDLAALDEVTPAAADALYAVHRAAYERERFRCAQQTRLGRNAPALREWCARVAEVLGVDNYERFGVGE